MQGYFKVKSYGEFDNKRSARRLECLADYCAVAGGARHRIFGLWFLIKRTWRPLR
jgi:hypothetical protein